MNNMNSMNNSTVKTGLKNSNRFLFNWNNQKRNYGKICILRMYEYVIIMVNHLIFFNFQPRGIVLGVYSDEKTKSIKFTKFAEKYNQRTNGQLLKLIEM